MNIFMLDVDQDKCAKWHFDKHVVKMIIEYCQMLSTVNRLNGLDEGYRATHIHHPCTKWVGESLSNWQWLKRMMKSMNEEFMYRYGHTKPHASFVVSESLHEPRIRDVGMTAAPCVMDDKFIVGDTVYSYRNLYANNGYTFAKWSKRDMPEWFVEMKAA